MLPCTFGSNMTEWLKLLQTYNGAVVAIASMAGVLVTVVYAVFTVLLWKATKRQADITRLMFEASHRPYIIVHAKEPIDPDVRNRLSFSLVLTNDGNVPANITRWEMQATLLSLERKEEPVSLMDPVQTLVGRSLSPHGPEIIPLNFLAEGISGPTLSAEGDS